MGLPKCKFHNPIFNRFCMIHDPSDRQTDGRAIAYAHCSIYMNAIARKNQITNKTFKSFKAKIFEADS